MDHQHPSDPLLPDNPTLSYLPSTRGFDQGLGSMMATQLPRWSVQPAESECEGTEVPAETLRDGTAPYVLKRLIGCGGMGEIWEAEQASLSRTVAVKRLRRDKARAEETGLTQWERAMFRREALIAGRLEHPNIVPVHDQGMDERGEPLLAMKRVHGRPWDELIEEDWEKLEVQEFLARHLPVLMDMAQAVAFAHAKGIVHRDLKPAQVMVGEFGETLLMDWGLAVFIGETDRPESLVDARRIGLATRETATCPCGTPSMMAPEQTLPDAMQIGPWTDIFLLGGTLYVLLTGSYPYQAKTGHRAFELACAGVVEPPRVRRPGRHIPDDLNELCLRCLQCDPDDRLPGAREFVDAIRDHLTGEGRRREAEEITARIAAGGMGTTYEQLTAELADLNRARMLDAANPRVDPLEGDRIARLSELALEGGDLRLARLQADRLAAGDGRRAALITRVQEAQGRLDAQARQRRFALRAVAVLVAFILLGGGVFTAALSRERNRALDSELAARRSELVAKQRAKEAEEARLLAETQSGIAAHRVAQSQDLVTFLLNDLSKQLDLRDTRDLAIARRVGDKVIEFCQSIDTSSDSQETQLTFASFLDGVAKTLTGFSRPAEGLSIATRALAIKEGLLAGSDPRVADSLHEIGVACDNLGKLEEGERVQRRAYEIRRAALGESAVDTLRSLHNVGLNLMYQGRLPEGEEALVQMRAAILENRADDTYLLGRMLNTLANIYKQTGRNTELESVLRESIALLEKSPSATPQDKVYPYSNLAELLFENGDVKASVEAAERAMALLVEGRAGLDEPQLATVAQRLALCYEQLGDKEKDQEFSRLRYEALRSSDGEDGELTATAWFNWLLACRRAEDTELLAREAPKFVAWVDGGGSFETANVARVEHWIGNALNIMDDPAGGAMWMRRARQRALTAEEPDYAFALGCLHEEVLYLRQAGEDEELARVALSAYPELASHLPIDSPEAAEFRLTVTNACAGEKGLEEALDMAVRDSYKAIAAAGGRGNLFDHIATLLLLFNHVVREATDGDTREYASQFVRELTPVEDMLLASDHLVVPYLLAGARCIQGREEEAVTFLEAADASYLAQGWKGAFEVLGCADCAEVFRRSAAKAKMKAVPEMGTSPSEDNETD